MKNIVFIGMMGTWKTSVSILVAKALGMQAVDTDELFESRYMPIAGYFTAYGEAAFRDREAELVREVASMSDTVVSCGGGVVLRRDNMEALRANGVVVLLTASETAIVERVGRGETRPLLTGSVAENVRRISRERQPLYQMYADIVIDNTAMTSASCAAEALRLIKPLL